MKRFTPYFVKSASKKLKSPKVLLRADVEEALERLLMGHSPKWQSLLESAKERFRAGQRHPSREVLEGS